MSVQSPSVEMQSLDENGKKTNVQSNPQPTVTAQTLQMSNKNFLHDLHRLKKSCFIRPADAKKPQTAGEKILSALKTFGHAVRSLIYGSKNAEATLRTHFDELQVLAFDVRNNKIPVEEYKEIQKQTNANIKEIKKFLSSAKEEHKSLLNEYLKFYEDFSKELGFDKRQKWSDFKYKPFPTDPAKQSNIRTLADNWKQQTEKLTTLKEDGKRIPNKNLSKDDIQSLKDTFAELSKAWISFGEKQVFKNVISEEEYQKYGLLCEDIMNAYAKQQDKTMSDFICGNFTSIVQGQIEKDYASHLLSQLQSVEDQTTDSASIELRQQLQLLKILLALKASPDDKEALGNLLSNKIQPKEEDCIFLVQHFETLKTIAPNAPLVEKIEKIKSDLPGYLSACYEQNIVNPWEYEEDDKEEIQENIKSKIPFRKTMQNERLLTAAKLYASDTQPSGVFNMNIERLRRNLETDRKIFEKSEKIDNGKTTAKLTPAEKTRKFEMPEDDVRNKIGQLLEIRNLFELEDKTSLEDLLKNSDEDISTAAKGALEKLETL